MDRFFGLDSSTFKDSELEHLTFVNDKIYLSMVETLLKDNDIPYFTKERGSGGAIKVIMGFSIFGADVFVPKQYFEKASELIAQFQIYVENDEDTEDDDNEGNYSL